MLNVRDFGTMKKKLNVEKNETCFFVKKPYFMKKNLGV